MTINEKMAALKALLAQRCWLEWSEYTKQWYVSSSIDISDDEVRVGATEHRDSPEEAINAYWQRLTGISIKEHLIVYRGEGKPDWRGRWNGYMWEERR